MHSDGSFIFTAFHIVNILQCPYPFFCWYIFRFLKKFALTNTAVIHILFMCLHECKNFLATYLEVVILRRCALLSDYSPKCCTAVLCNDNPMDRKWFNTMASSTFPLLIIRLIIFSYVQQLAIAAIIFGNQPPQNLEAIISFYGFPGQLVQLCFRMQVCGCTSVLGVSYPS